MVNNIIKNAVDRFLGWKLPKDFHPDCGIKFEPKYNNGTEQGGLHEPVGTNLFDAMQAEAMIRAIIGEDLDLLVKAIDEQKERAVAEAVREERTKHYAIVNYILNKNSHPDNKGIDFEKAYRDFEEYEKTLE